MALPEERTVTGKYVNPVTGTPYDGVNEQHYVIFEPVPSRWIDRDGSQILLGGGRVDLGEDGAFAEDMVCTDASGVQPETGRLWRIRQYVGGVWDTQYFTLPVGDGPIDILDVLSTRAEDVAYIPVPGTPGRPGRDGEDGLPGASAYEVAVAAGFVGSQEEWLDSLRGATGLSAYDEAALLGFEGTEEQWIESLRGADGANGIDGADGANGADGTDGAPGRSAYDIAVQEGFTGSEVEWIQSLHGNDGGDGESAFAVAVRQGFQGTESQWLASLKGADGIDGTDGTSGTDGDSAYEVAVAEGFVGDRTAWLASLKGPSGEPGTSGASAYQIAVDDGYQGTEAEWLTSLHGEDGDPGSAGPSAYEVAVQNGFAGTVQDWLDSLQGVDGQDGAAGATGQSAYEVAVAAGFTGTPQEWLDSLKGPAGEEGETGLSAYELAVDNGFTGTVQEWIDSLQGERGEQGDVGPQPPLGAAGEGPSVALRSDDPTTTNARTPTAHAATHGVQGADRITPALIGAQPLEMRGVHVPAGWGGHWRAARANASTKAARIVTLGGSATQGLYASNPHTKSWPGLVKSALQAEYGDGGSGFFTSSFSATFFGSGDPQAVAAWTAQDAMATQTGTWALSANRLGPGITGVYTSTAGATMTFKVRGSIVKIYTIAGAGRPPFTYAVDGGSPASVTQGSTTAVQVTTITGLSNAEHTVVLTAGAGDYLTVAGVAGENATGVIVDNLAKAGAGSASYATLPETALNATWNGGVNYPCDLAIYTAGPNDASSDVTPDAWVANVAAWLRGVRDIGTSQGATDIIIGVPHFGRHTTANFRYAEYGSRVYDLARSYGAAVVNWWEMGRNSWPYWQTLGFWGTSAATGAAGTDSVHMSDAGFAAMAAPVIELLKS